MKKALILGCGPSGLLAAHAATLANWEPIVVSSKRPSPLFGCQYLHREIPELTTDGGRDVQYLLFGTVEEYADKVYGPDRHPSLKVSPESLVGTHKAWDIRLAYRKLWNRYEEGIVDERLQADDIESMMSWYRPDVFINTIPLPLLCANPDHDFQSVKCWAIGDAPELGQYAPHVTPEFTVACDSSSDVGYYRASNVFGYSTIEWPGWRSKPPVQGVVDFLKPLSTSCDCWPRVTRMGRMGMWRKGVLAHEAFFDTQELLKGF